MKLIIRETVSVHRFPINFLLHLFLASGVPVRVRYTLFSTLLVGAATAVAIVVVVFVVTAATAILADFVVIVIFLFLLLPLLFFSSYMCVRRVVWYDFLCVPFLLCEILICKYLITKENKF